MSSIDDVAGASITLFVDGVFAHCLNGHMDIHHGHTCGVCDATYDEAAKYWKQVLKDEAQREQDAVAAANDSESSDAGAYHTDWPKNYDSIDVADRIADCNRNVYDNFRKNIYPLEKDVDWKKHKYLGKDAVATLTAFVPLYTAIKAGAKITKSDVLNEAIKHKDKGLRLAHLSLFIESGGNRLTV